MFTKNNFLLAVFIFLVGFYESQAQCSCVYVTPESKHVEIVFVGKIFDISKEEKANKYQIQISEIFKGLHERKTVDVYDGFYNCNERRILNKEYLFLAARNIHTNKINIVGCSYSYNNKYRQKQMIEILRWKKNSQNQGGIIVGKVFGKVDNDETSKKPNGVDKVFLEYETREKFEANIEADGFYKFENLKDGVYKVYLELPKSLTTYGDAKGFDWESAVRPNIKVSKNDGIIQDFSILTNGIVNGKVFDSDGLPVSSITVNLIGSDGYIDDSTKTNQDGYYEFKGIQAEKYLIRVGVENSYISPTSKEAIYPTTFYPNVISQKNAGIIRIGESEITENRNITLSPISKKRVVTGKVLMPDGKPAVNANVTVQIKRKEENGNSSSGWYVMTNTDSSGNFTLETYEDTEYLTKFDVDKLIDDVTVEVLFSAKCFILHKSSEIKPLKITLKKGDIECDEESFGF